MGHLRLVAPDIHKGDAVGNHCLELVRIFNSKGRSAVAYAERHSNGVSDLTQFFLDLEPGDIIIVSFSIYDPLLIELLKLKNYKICYFHGITPPKYLSEHDPTAADLCQLGLQQIYLLDKFDLVICNSAETAKSLMGYINPKKIDVLYPISQKIISTPQNYVASKYHYGDCLKIVMLGRIVPHKAIEDGLLLVDSLRNIGIKATLDLVGTLGSSNYIDYINKISKQLNLADKISFHGFVDENQKSVLMKNSDVFFSASYNEGFGIPILEAMGYGLPIIIRSGAIPKEISAYCLGYSSIEQAAAIINQFYTRPLGTYPIKNLIYYRSIFNNYSDDNIFQFFQSKILNT